MSEYMANCWTNPTWKSCPPENISERHLLIMVLLDTSSSMRTCQSELNKAVRRLLNNLKEDAATRGAAEVCIVQFGGDVRVLLPFQPLRLAQVPEVTCAGGTPLYEAVSVGLDLLEKRRRELKERPVPVPLYKPFFFVISDGEPTDMPTDSFARLRAQQKPTRPGATCGRIFVYPVGLGDHFEKEQNQLTLASLSAERQVFTGDYAQLSECFRFVSSTTFATLHTLDGEAVELPTPEEFGLTRKQFTPAQIPFAEMLDDE